MDPREGRGTAGLGAGAVLWPRTHPSLRPFWARCFRRPGVQGGTRTTGYATRPRGWNTLGMAYIQKAGAQQFAVGWSPWVATWEGLEGKLFAALEC